MQKNTTISPVWIGRALSALLLFNLALIGYYILFDYQSMMHSDSAVKNLLAQEIVETGSYFPRDWNYVNGDLWVFYTQTFIVPLLLLFPNSFRLHAASGLITAGLILFGTWQLTGVMGQSRTARLLSMAVLSCGMSLYMAENLYGQASYGSMYYMSCFMLLFAWRFLFAAPRARLWWGAAFVVINVLLFLANPQRAVIYQGAPFMLGLATLLLFDLKLPVPGERRRLALLTGLFVAGAVLGVVLHEAVLRNVNNAIGIGPATWMGFDGMMVNLLGTLRGLLGLLGGLPDAGAPLISFTSVYHALRLLAALALLALIPWALSSLMRSQERGRLFVVSFTLGSVALSLFLHLSSSLASATDPEGTARYLVPPLLFGLIVLVGALVDGVAGRRTRVIGLCAVLILATSGIAALRSPVSRGVLEIGARPAAERRELAEFLVSSGLKYGYSTFWNAGVTSVFSKQQARVRQIEIENGLPRPMLFLASDRWYRPAAWTGETFLLLEEAEAKAINWDALTALVGQPSRKLQFRHWQIVAFPKNIAADLPKWKIDRTVRVGVGEDTPHLIGRFIDGPKPALVAEVGQAGPLLFGPFSAVKSGKIKAVYSIEVEGTGADFGHVDITSESGKTVHAQQAITQPGVQRLELPAQLDKDVTRFEMRVFTNGVGKIKVYEVKLERLP